MFDVNEVQVMIQRVLENIAQISRFDFYPLPKNRKVESAKSFNKVLPQPSKKLGRLLKLISCSGWTAIKTCF